MQEEASNSSIMLCRYKQKQTPWPESASELHRLSDRRLSVKLVTNLRMEGCRVVSVRDPYGRNLGFLDRSRYFFSFTLSCTHDAEWTPFQAHYFLENLVAPGIEPGPLDL
jgi:hypothetical protein